MKKVISQVPGLVLALIVFGLCAPSALASATIIIQNTDDPGEGFNDTTPATPIGGNTGTTVGQQRLNAFTQAANIWGQTLTSGPTIVVRASWSNLACTASTGTLGSASATTFARNFPGAPVNDTWYPASLVNALANSDTNSNAEISAQFNAALGTTGCLEALSWYYGLDTNHAGNQVNLVTVLLHEFAHGLGFSGAPTSSATGAQTSGFPSIYDRFLLDIVTGKTWNQMTDAERVNSAINTGNLVWNGPQSTADSTILNTGKDPQGHPLIYAPNPRVAGSSVSHWSNVLSPNQLMEPNNSFGLTHSVTTPQDLTFSLLRDIGWCSGCPQPPPPSPTPTPVPPANDNFANAQVLSGCSGSVTGTNVGSTKESGEPAHLPVSSGSAHSVWYQWQAPSTGNVTITTENSDYDTTLAVYTGSSVGALSLIVNDDDSGPGTTSSVTFAGTAGVTYRIAVDGYDNDSGGDMGNIRLNWSQSNCVSLAPTIQLSQAAYSYGEANTSAFVTITRSGDLAGAATVDYFTSDSSGQTKCEPQPATGLASERCDYQTTVGTVTIPSGQASVVISIPLVNDVHVEGNETFSFSIRNAVGTTLGTLTAATITITENDTVFTQANPIDTFEPYVRQQYLDFLSREPDSGGFAFWMGRLQTCAATPGCDMVRERKMVSAGFFYSNEFLLRKGYFVYRFYGASLGRRPTYAEFIPDLASMGQNDAEEEAKRVEFTNRWVTRADFVALYPNTLSNTEFVNKLVDTAGITLDRNQLITQLNGGTTRAQIVRQVAESQQAFDKFFKEAFISMQYFGYLRRDPDAGGYDYWFGRLPATRQEIDANPDLYIYDMVGGFVYSTEYQLRFGNRNY